MRKIRKTLKTKTYFPTLCGALLAIFTIAVLCPLENSDADALDGATTAATRAVLNASNTLSVSLEKEVTLDVTPTGDGSFTSMPARLTVTTNNPKGYSVYLNTADSTNALTYTDPTFTGPQYEIAPLSGTTTAANFSANTWGYALTDDAATDATEYRPVPLSTTKIDSVNHFIAESQRNLTFAAKVDGNRPAGQYENHVMVSVIAHPSEVTNLSQLVYMQDMTRSICRNTPLDTSDFRHPATKQLIDLRDGKEYWVARLADGNCWMTQNLALDIDAEKGLDATTTDLNGTNTFWKVGDTGVDTAGQPKIAPETTQTSLPEPVASPSYTTTGSVNLGAWVKANPEILTSCGPGVTSMSDCIKFGMVDVGPNTPYYHNSTHTAQIGSWTSPDGTLHENQLLAIDEPHHSYDAHYLTGNYYQWNTATAGSGGAIHSRGAVDSICPKGWTLPKGVFEAGSTDSLYDMINQYGLASSTTGTGADGNSYNIFAAPTHFTASGWIGATSQYPHLRYTSSRFTLWTRTASWSDKSDLALGELNYEDSSVTHVMYERYSYFPVRCLAY